MRISAVTTVAAVVLAGSLVGRDAQAQQTALLLPVRGDGAPPAALEAATRSLQRRLQAQGYTVVVLDSEAPAPGVPPAELGALVRERGASLLVDPSLQDFAGMTSLQVRIVGPDGAVLGEDADLAHPDTLPQEAALVLANAMRSVPRERSPATGSGLDSPFGEAAPDAGAAPPALVRPAPRPALRPPPRRRRRPDFPERRFWLGGVIEPAMGTNRSSFNLTTGARGEFQWRGLTVGLDFHYTYIKDWEPRSNPDYHTMSLFGMVGYQIRLGSDRLSLPLLAGGGYIPGNGGLLRFEAGLSIRPIDRLQIRLIFVCPNFWFVGDEMVLFTSISIALLAGL